jgi:hypothetical protein
VAPLLDDAAILVIRRFNQEGFAEASETGVVVADGVVALARGEDMRGVGSGEVAPPPGLAAPALFLLSVGSLAVLGLLGWGWARWMLPHAGRRGIALGAPSVGLAAVILAAAAVDLVGLLPFGAAALAASIALGAAGYGLAARDTR